jgi:hypothetical protein
MSVPNSNSTASLANWCATTESEQLWNIWSATNAGVGGDSDVAVGVDGVTRVPLNVNAAGELKVNVEASIDADLADIENALATTNGILTTTAADTAIIKNEAISIDAKLPALSNGRVPVDSNSVPSTTFTYTNTAAIPINTVLIGPIDCSQFKEICVQTVSLGAGSISVQISNDGTNFVQTAVTIGTAGNTFGSATQGTGQIVNYTTLGAKFARVYALSAIGVGTTNIVAVFNQIPTTKTFVDASIRSVISSSPSIGAANWGPTSMLAVVSTASTNATNIKASAAQVFTLVASNTSAAFKFLKIFNKASAPTLGTDTPVLNIAIPPNSSVDVGTNTFALRLTLGLSYAITGGSALLDNTAVGAGDVCFSIVHS